MPEQRFLARIHILKKQAGLTDDQYRVLLSGWGVASSTEFTNKRAAAFANFLQKEVIKDTKTARWGEGKYEDLRKRPGDFASPPQLRMIEAMWREIARNPDDAALEKFIYRQTGIKKLIWLKKKNVQPVIIALQKMKEGTHEKS